MEEGVEVGWEGWERGNPLTAGGLRMPKTFDMDFLSIFFISLFGLFKFMTTRRYIFVLPPTFLES